MALPEAIRARIAAAQARIGSSGVKWLTLESGKPVDIHVLDGEYGIDKLWYVKQGIHYLGEGQEQVRVTCPRVTADRDCPICQLFRTVKDEVTAKKQDLDGSRKSMSAADVTAAEQDIAGLEEMADSLYVSIRFVFNVVVKGESQVRLFNCPKTIFEEIFNTWAKNAEQLNMFDAKSSYFFTVQREGKGQTDTRYKVTTNMVPAPIAPTPEGIDKLLAARHNLDEEIKVPTFTDVQTALTKFLNGEAPAKEGAPAASPAASAPAPKPVEAPAPAPVVNPATAAPAAAGMSPAARLKAKLAAAAK